jgi:hypothetical protein
MFATSDNPEPVASTIGNCTTAKSLTTALLKNFASFSLADKKVLCAWLVFYRTAHPDMTGKRFVVTTITHAQLDYTARCADAPDDADMSLLPTMTEETAEARADASSQQPTRKRTPATTCATLQCRIEALCDELTGKYRLSLPVGMKRRRSGAVKSVLLARVAQLQDALVAATDAVIPVSGGSLLLALGGGPASLVDQYLGWCPAEPDLQDVFQTVQSTNAIRLTCHMMRARYGLQYLTALFRSFPLGRWHMYTKTMGITTSIAEFSAAGEQLRYEMCHWAHAATPARVFRAARIYARQHRHSRDQSHTTLELDGARKSPANYMFGDMVYRPSPRILKSLGRLRAQMTCMPPGDAAHVGGHNFAVRRLNELEQLRNRRIHTARAKRECQAGACPTERKSK